MIHDTKSLIVIEGTLANIVRAHERPYGPLRVIAKHVLPQALEIRVVRVGKALVGPAGHAEAELGEDEGRGVALVLHEHEAVEEPVGLLEGAAVAVEEREGDGELVGVPLPDVLARPRAPVDVALGADVREVRRRLRAAHEDEHVRVGLVHARRRLAEEVVPVRAPVERALEEKLADLVAEAHPDHAWLRRCPCSHGLDAVQPVVRVEETTVGGVIPGPLIPPPISISKVA